ncbi:MAG TPA: RNA pseudouridine synthase [Opitutaceae bacterium]|nr:RNA pseudouridine synthase [Opitutaceae bacterium]
MPDHNLWNELPLGRGVVLLDHDENGLVAFNKPAGVLSHPNAVGDEPRSLLTVRYALEGECFEWTPGGETAAPPRRLWLLNRLDSATSGVILAAAEEQLAVEIRAQFKRKQVRKIYQALVFGAPRQAVELWRDRLATDKRGGMIRTSSVAGHVPAETRMSVIRSAGREPRVALLKLEPRTGRSHQLRVQCAKRALPIVGDQTYGDFARNREFAKFAGTKRMFLHSFETTFEYDWRGRRFAFSARAPLPPEFVQFL